MATPTTSRPPAASSPPSGQQAQAQAQRRAYRRRKTRAKVKSEALRQREAAHVEALPVQHPHAAGIGALSNLSEGRFLVTDAHSRAYLFRRTVEAGNRCGALMLQAFRDRHRGEESEQPARPGYGPATLPRLPV